MQTVNESTSHFNYLKIIYLRKFYFANLDAFLHNKSIKVWSYKNAW